MKFIKEMMTRKHRPAENDENLVEEFAEDLDDSEGNEPTDDELYSGIAAIQALLDEQPDALDEDELAELAEMEADEANNGEEKPASAPAVVNFADLVSDIQNPKSEVVRPAEPMAKAPDLEPKIEAEIKKPSATDPASDLETKVVTEAHARNPVETPTDENAKTADELAAALGPGVTVTVKDRPSSKHAAFDQKRFVSMPEPDDNDAETPIAEASVDAEPKERTDLARPSDAAPGKPPRLVVEEAEIKSPSLAPTEAKEPPMQANIIEVPAPAAGRSGRRAGRVKTRLLGFNHGNEADNDPFENNPSQSNSSQFSFPTGWIVIVDGPGRGASFTLYNGVSQIGRGDDQPIKLGFGDNSISRSNHAAIAYDDQEHKFFLGHGGKANLVRLNDRPVLSTEEITSNDLIRIGETTLRFVGFCGAHFDWGDDAPEEMDDAAIA